VRAVMRGVMGSHGASWVQAVGTCTDAIMQRSPELPNVPTIAEAGVKGYEMVAWFGIAAPKGLPRDLQMRLHAALLKVLQSSEMQSSLRNVGQQVAFQEKPEQFYDIMKVEAAKWGKVVQESGARVE
jgi:tripartite-type tricarboxylate transporter receptor subunit TctC